MKGGIRAAVLRVSFAASLVACGVARPSPTHGRSDREEADAGASMALAPADAATSGAPSAVTDEPPRERVEDDAGGGAPTFAPRDVGPMRAGAPKDDGTWKPVDVAKDASAPSMWKAVLHPDKARPAAGLFVVAIDLSRVRLHSVAGASEPATEAPAAKGLARAGVVPADRQDALLAAFNGGWKGEHGHYGLAVERVTFVKPRDGACTIAVYEDDGVRIAPWAELAEGEHRMRLFRQTPACMYARGARHGGLAAEATTNWGAAANGDPVIRRSAIGLDERRSVLLFAVSDAMTAPAVADGMHHAGAQDVAELDVNWSFPKFVVFERSAAGVLEASSLFSGFVSTKGEYVRQRSARDFFYVVRR